MLRIFSVGLLFVILITSSFKTNKTAYPENLSEWGIFEGKMSKLIPKKDLVPYALNTPLYSDYSEKIKVYSITKRSKGGL